VTTHAEAARAAITEYLVAADNPEDDTFLLLPDGNSLHLTEDLLAATAIGGLTLMQRDYLTTYLANWACYGVPDGVVARAATGEELRAVDLDASLTEARRATLVGRTARWWAGVSSGGRVAVLGGLAVVVAVTSAGITAASLGASSDVPSGWHSCGTTGAICPDDDSASNTGSGSGAGTGAGSGSVAMGNCHSYDFGNGTISVQAHYTVTNPDTVAHRYEVTVQTWRGFGARPTEQQMVVQPGQTYQGMASGMGSNSAVPNEPYPVAACQILQFQTLS
jgi:hypothetical protein